jgi:disulfide bond formation protein DsbB
MSDPVLTFFHSCLKPRRALLCFALASIGVLAAALIAEYGFGLRPCHLCLLQRIPYTAVAVIGIGALWLHNQRLLRYALILVMLLFLGGAGLAIYHSGVEYGVFTGPSGCTLSDGVPDSIEEMRRQIAEAALVSCDQPGGFVFGLSLAVWNSVIYLFLTILAAYVYYRSHSQDVAE